MPARPPEPKQAPKAAAQPKPVVLPGQPKPAGVKPKASAGYAAPLPTPGAPKKPVRPTNAFMMSHTKDMALKGITVAAEAFKEGTPIPGTEVAFVLVGEIARMVGQARANKKQVQSLYQRVQSISLLVENVRTTYSSFALFNAVNRAVTCLENCKAQVKKFTEKSFFQKVLSSGSDKEKFAELNQDVTEVIHTLQLALSLKINQTVEQINTQVMKQHQQDVAADNQAILDCMAELLTLEKEHLEETRKVQEQVEGVAMQVEDAQTTLALQLDSAQIKLMDQITEQTETAQTTIVSKLEELSKALGNIQFSQHQAPSQLASSSEEKALSQEEVILKRLKVNMDKVQFEAVINQGSFGTIYKGHWMHEPVAIKVIGQTLRPAEYKQFGREVNIMASLRHPNITQIFAASKEPKACFVMEYMSHGSLEHYLETNPIAIDEQLSISLDITKGLAYMHEQDALHRDLKTANVLINKHKQAKLTDFGLSKKLSSKAQQSLGELTHDIHWMAPEVMDAGRSDEFKAHSDIYSFGMILWSVFTGKKPFSDWPIKELADITQFSTAIIQQGLIEAYPEEAPPPVQEIITQCWSRATHTRPELNEVAKTLKDIDPIPDESAEKLCEKGQAFEQKQQFKQAFRHYQKSAKMGYYRAMTNLGTFLLNGLGCEEDKPQAAKWFEKSVNPKPEEKREPHNRAACNLARMYDKGDGIEKDMQQAIHYYEIAARTNFPGAKERLKQIKNVDQPHAPGMKR